MLCFITNEKGAESSKILNLFFHDPYSREMMIVDISLDCVVSQRPLWGTLVRLPRPLSLMCPYSRKVMIVLRLSMYGFVSDGCVLGLLSVPTSNFDRISPGSKHFFRCGF